LRNKPGKSKDLSCDDWLGALTWRYTYAQLGTVREGGTSEAIVLKTCSPENTFLTRQVGQRIEDCGVNL